MYGAIRTSYYNIIIGSSTAGSSCSSGREGETNWTFGALERGGGETENVHSNEALGCPEGAFENTRTKKGKKIIINKNINADC